MASIYDKLNHFNDVILKDATLERDRILQQIKSQADERIALEKRKLEEEADQLLKKESVLAENEKNNIISRAVIEGRQLLVKTRDDIIEAIFNDTKKALEDFARRDEYVQYLFRQIRHSCSLAGKGEIKVYLCRRDIERFSRQIEDMREELPFNAAFEQTDNDIIGGCKVLNITKDVIVDSTLLGKLVQYRDSILEICDLSID